MLKSIFPLGRKNAIADIFLLRDDFTGNVAAGLLNNTLATDGINLRLASDTENKLSVVSDRLVFNGGKTAPAIGNPGLKYSVPFARAEGMTLDAAVRVTGSSQGAIGFHNTATPAFGLKSGIRFLNAKFYDAVSTTDLVTRSWSNADKIVRVVIHATGYNIYTSENGGLSFFLEHQNITDVTNPLYLHAASYNLVGGYDWIHVTKTPRGAFYDSFYDDFSRADTVPIAGTAGTVGSLGQSPQGMPWVVLGSNLPYISGNHFVVAHNAASAGYGFLYFPTSVMPHTMRATVSWDNIGGAGAEALAVLIAGTNPLTDMVHAIFNRDSVGITVWDNADGGSHTSIGTVNYPLCDFGTQYQIGMRVSGDTVTIETPDGVETSFTHAAIGSHWGRNLCYELTSPVDGSAQPKFKNTTVLW